MDKRRMSLAAVRTLLQVWPAQPSVTAAAHLVNYSYLGPGRGEGPRLLRIRKSREIVQAVSGRAEVITHGLLTWTPVLSVLKSSLWWWALLGVDVGCFIRLCRITLQGCQIHGTAPRHEAGLYIKVSSVSLCFNLWLCILSGLCSGWEEGLKEWPLGWRWTEGVGSSSGAGQSRWQGGVMGCLPLCAGVGDTWEHGKLAVDSNKVTHKLVAVGNWVQVQDYWDSSFSLLEMGTKWSSPLCSHP